MLTNDKKLEQLLFEEEAGNFYDIYSKEENVGEDDIDKNLHNNCEIIFTTKYNIQQTQDLLTAGKFIMDIDPLMDNYSNEYFSDITSKLDGDDFLNNILRTSVEIEGQYSFADAINIIANVKIQMGDEFYGALLIEPNKQYTFNPLHHLVAVEYLKHRDDNDTFNVFIFSNSNVDKFNLEDNAKERAKNNIINQLGMYAIRGIVKSRRIIDESRQSFIDNVLENDKHVLKTKISYSAERNDNGDEIYVVPQQLLTSGLAIPYYGTTLYKVTTNSSGDRSSYGSHITPMLGVNTASGWSGRKVDHAKDITFDSVCTGNEVSTTIKGILTHNHSNLSSPYFSNCVMEGWHELSQEAINTSLMIYKDLLNKDTCNKLGFDCDEAHKLNTSSDNTDKAENEKLIESWSSCPFNDISSSEPCPALVSLKEYTDYLIGDSLSNLTAGEILLRYREANKYLSGIDTDYTTPDGAKCEPCTE
jgi:hypothetical protein